MRFIFRIILLSQFILTPVCAQYVGGNNNGSNVGNLILKKIGSGTFNANAIYYGGSGFGSNSKFVSYFLDDTRSNFLYSGGFGFGNYSTIHQSNIDGTSYNFLLSGGNGDGSYVTQKSYSISGEDVSLYKGGSDDGFDQNLSAYYINGISSEIQFSGGDDDGSNYDLGIAILSEGSVLMYFGGNNEGSDKKRYQGHLNQSGINKIFSGGKGDGFSIKLSSLQINGETSSKSNNLSSSDFIIFPNPSNGTFINISGPTLLLNRDTKIYILDIQGKAIEYHKASNAEYFALHFNSKIKPGIYIVQLINDNNSASLVMIIE